MILQTIIRIFKTCEEETQSKKKVVVFTTIEMSLVVDLFYDLVWPLLYRYCVLSSLAALFPA